MENRIYSVVVDPFRPAHKWRVLDFSQNGASTFRELYAYERRANGNESVKVTW